MVVAGLLFVILGGVSVLMMVSSWLFKYPGLFWLGLAIAVISWAAIFTMMLTDKTYAKYETRKERILEALDYSGVRYPLFSIAFAACVVMAILMGMLGGIGYAIWRFVLWSRYKCRSVA